MNAPQGNLDIWTKTIVSVNPPSGLAKESWHSGSNNIFKPPSRTYKWPLQKIKIHV